MALTIISPLVSLTNGKAPRSDDNNKDDIRVSPVFDENPRACYDGCVSERDDLTTTTGGYYEYG